MFNHDLFSNKIGPLIFDGINSEMDDLIKHQLILLLISERPPEWRKHIEEYIATIPKNSFYLYDTVIYLSSTYRYAFASDTELSEIRHLLKMGFAKHEFGGGKPKLSDLSKISNKVIPKERLPSPNRLVSFDVGHSKFIEPSFSYMLVSSQLYFQMIVINKKCHAVLLTRYFSTEITG